jgi:hypothetical protein
MPEVTKSNWTPQEIEDAVKKVMAKGSTDAAFRNLALTEPNKAVEQVANKPVPAGVKVRFVEANGAQYTIVLPDLRSSDPSELTDAELEHVAGGRCAASCALSCGVTSTVTVGIPGVGGVACI